MENFIYICTLFKEMIDINNNNDYPMRKRIILFFLLAFTLIFSGCTEKQNTANDSQQKITSANDLKGKTVAVISGALQDVVYSDLFGNDIMRIQTAPEVLAACESGQADFCMMDSVHFIGAKAEERGVHYCFTDTLGGNVGVAFNKNSTLLCETYNEWLSKAKEEGLMQEIINRWTKGDVANAHMPELGPAPVGEPLRIGITTDFPFAFVQDGNWTGLEVEMAERWGRSIGRPVDLQVLDFSALIASLETNRTDAICAFMYITPERQEQVLFSEPYYSSHTVVFQHRGNATVSSWGWSGIKQRFNDNIIKEDRWKLLFEGLWETVVISFWAIIFGTLIGGFVCWMRMSRSRILSSIAKVFVDFIRGIPILVFLMILFYIVFASTPLTARWVAIIAFAINFGAYVSEMFRTGIQSIDKGQTEAGLALGFTKVATFFTFIVPQALKHIIPVYKGEVISIIKSTSVVGYIAIQDLTKVSDIIRSRTFDAFFPLIIVSIIYLFLAWFIGKLLDRLNTK